MFSFCLTFALICCVCDFIVDLKSVRREENEFQLFLCLSQEIPAWGAVEFIRIECVDEVGQLNSYSHLPRI
jgi:hypothetical protein